ncbi:hypothetical protein [Paenibacillus sp. TH7-28]
MNAVAWTIVACEIAFWVVIAAGLIVRYLWKRPKLGLALLALTPVIDLILFVITGVDLYNEATATTAHALAAVYIGVSIASGKSMIDWADAKFRFYVAKEEAVKPAKRYGMDHAKHELKGFIRHILAFLIGGLLLAGMIYFINDSSRTEALLGVLRVWGIVLCVDLVITVTYFIWPKQIKK